MLDRVPGALRISQVGLRGVVGPALTANHVLDFAAAFGTFLQDPGPVVIARDHALRG
jgi:phosphomannomutase